MLPVDPKTATFFAATDIGHSRRQRSNRRTRRRRGYSHRLDPIVPVATSGCRAIGPALQKMIFELAREGWRGPKSHRRRRGKRGEQAILGRAECISKSNRKLSAVVIVSGISRHVWQVSVPMTTIDSLF